MPEKLDGSRLLLALGAVVLLVSLFIDWFKPGLTAWTVFEIVDLLLAAIAVAALVGVAAQALPGARLAEPPPGAPPVLAGTALVLVIAALLNHPPAAVGRSVDSGIWIGFAGAALMTIGALLGVGRVSLVITRRSGGPGPRRPGRRPAARGAPPPHEPTQPLGYEDLPGADPQTQALPEERR